MRRWLSCVETSIAMLESMLMALKECMGKGFGKRNEEGEVLLEFACSRDMIIAKTWFDKEDSKKVSYESGGCKTVVDYILVRKIDRAKITDVKIIDSEPCIFQSINQSSLKS